MKVFDDITKVLSSPAGVIIAGGIGLYVAYKLFTGPSAPTGPGGVSNQNALTTLLNGNNAEDSDYAGYGVLGTLGATTNTLTGGGADALGNWLGGLFAPSYDPNAGSTPAPTILGDSTQ